MPESQVGNKNQNNNIRFATNQHICLYMHTPRHTRTHENNFWLGEFIKEYNIETWMNSFCSLIPTKASQCFHKP